MAGRPKIFNEQTAIHQAVDLFWRKGYEASSTDELIQVMGVQRGSFYHSFKSKRDLYILALDTHENESFNVFEKELNKSDLPMKVLKNAFLQLADCSDNEHMLGCFAGNTIAEFSGIDEELVNHAKKHLKRLEGIMVRQIRTSQQSGELKTKEDAVLLGRYLLNLWNGVNITRRIYPDKKSLRDLISFQLELIK